MVTTPLPDNQQKLYDNLKTAIKSGVAANVLDILDKQNIGDLHHVFNVENRKLYDLLDYTTGKGRAVAGVIFTGYEKARSEGDFKIHLYNKIYDAIVSNQPNQESVAEGIWEFAGINHMDIILSFNLENHFIDAILNNNQDQDNANKIFNFAKKHKEQDTFLMSLDTTLRDAILKDQKDNVINILNFASNNNVLKDVLDYRGAGGTALELAKQIDRTEIVKIIEKKKAELETQAQKDLLHLADELYSAIKGRKNIKSILASNSIQNVLMSMEVRGKEGNYYTFLIHAINCNYEEAAIDILNIANPDTLKPLLKERQEVMIKGRLVDYTALQYATEKGHQKLVKIIEAKSAELKAQHEPPKSADGQTAPPQGGQGEPHEEGDMPSTTSLTPEQQKLYDDLKDAIQSGIAADVDKVLSARRRMDLSAKGGPDDALRQQIRVDLSCIFKAENTKLLNLLNYTTDETRKAARYIFEKFVIAGMEKNFISHLSNKIYDAIVSKQENVAEGVEDVAEGIWAFARTNSIDSSLSYNLIGKFKDTILNNNQNQDNANKIFNFAKKHKEQDTFLMSLDTTLRDAILKDQKDNVINILNFASTHNLLKDLLDCRGAGGTALELAKKTDRIEIVKIIEAAEDKLKSENQHKSPKSADGQTAPPQSEQGESHEEGDMVTTPLPDDQQKLYDNLKAAIGNSDVKSVHNVLISIQTRSDLLSVFKAESPKLYDLLDYSTGKDTEIAGAILKTFRQFLAGGCFISHLSDKIYDAIVSKQENVTEGVEDIAEEILKLARINNIDSMLFSNLTDNFIYAILNNNQDKGNANEIFNFAKKNNKQKTFLSTLNNHLYGSILGNQENDVVGILNFASNHDVLKDVLNYRYGKATALDLAKQEGHAQIIAIIEAAEDKLKSEDQHEQPKAADDQAAPPQSGQGESHKKGDMPTDEDLQSLADKLLAAIINNTSVESILTSNSIQHVLIHHGVKDNAENFCTFLIYAIHYDRENVAIEILNIAHPETLAVLLEKKQEVMLDGNPVDYTALNYAIKKGHQKLVKIIEAAEDKLKSENQHKSPKSADGQTAPPQSEQGESHEEGDMVTTPLPDDQQKLYDDLKNEIKSGIAANVLHILNTQTHQNLLDVFKAENPKLYDLLNYTTPTGKEIAEKIFQRFKQVGIEGNFKSHLSDKMYDTVVSNQPNKENVAEGILEFANTNSIYVTLFSDLTSQFKYDVVNNQGHANEMLNFAKKYNEQDRFLRAINDTLYDAIINTERKTNNEIKNDIVSIFNFVNTNSLLNHANRNILHGFRGHTLLNFAKQEGLTEIVKIIEAKSAELKAPEPLADLDKQAFPEPTSDGSPLPPKYKSMKEYLESRNPNHSGNEQNKGFSSHGSSNETPTFFSKHGGKIAFGVAGLLLVIGGAVLCGFGQLAPGISLLIMGVVLAGALAMTTEKGQEMWDKASDKLSNLFVSKKEPNLRDI